MQPHTPRLLILVSHPIPYVIPLFRLMVQQGWDFCVGYCSMVGVQSYLDPDFATEVRWDVPLLEGYPWVELSNVSQPAQLGKFWGLLNPELLSWVGEFDGVIAYTGYTYASFWLALLAAKVRGKGFIFSTDTSSLASRDRASWKSWLKPALLPQIYRLADAILVSTSFGKEVVKQLGIPEKQIFLTPFVADNQWWLHQAAQVNPLQVRQDWGIPAEAVVIVFCAKLQPWKRPQDILHAFADANLPNCYLLYVGEGGMRSQLTATAQQLQIQARVKFLGFLNQTQLPAVYGAADILCLCSEYEPFGVVVNEAMLCQCAAIVSDQVGARELVDPDVTGYIYPCSDVGALSAILQNIVPQKDKLVKMQKAAQKRLETWSPLDNIKAQERAIQVFW
ncbi:glycosyltransferase [Spirulina sp. CS-785/01]|uniref:glycosyltransferase family 4 protein n=1 Tax=Spirulina sp. CS-785/01 TaxID=3021716 RepID=UPI00232FA4F1|nr:glycosyltransferase family 4 protein [Spirulina sp. CS-785/01]MDB9315229.1 glycosyltransferase [Spirulina sp. CS-785/01]